MDLLLIAWRYLVARPITLVSTLSVTVGLMAIVVVDSVMSGFLGEQRALIRALAPDVSIELDGLDAAQRAALASQLAADPDVTTAAARLDVSAIQYCREQRSFLAAPKLGDSYFVNLVGLEDAELSGPLNHVLGATSPAGASAAAQSFLGTSTVARPADPFWFDLDDEWWQQRLPLDRRHRGDLVPVLFGRHLAYQFDYRPGTVVTLATFRGVLQAGAASPTASREFVVVGTFATRDRAFDDTHALVPRAALGDFAGLDTDAHEQAVWGRGTPIELRDRLRRALAATVDPAAIRSWEDRRALLLGAVESERRVMNVAMFFVVIVATFSLFVTLHQLVRRKTRDIGILCALGASAMRAGRLFLLCGLIVTLAGSVGGLAGGIALAHWLNPLLDLVERLTGFRLFDRQLFSFKNLPVQIEFGRLVWYGIASVACGTLFTLLPAARAARQDPVEALRHE
ncbi:MAG: FtsX-like permease family protein [Planctomycetes bacterium]|nr:FtsX-like permease family protein [Planctomycetota bacterium]